MTNPMNDSRFFERHPERKHRVRYATRAEIEQLEIAGNKPLMSPGGLLDVRVVASSDYSARQFVPALKSAGTNVDEDLACAYFELLATELVERDRDMSANPPIDEWTPGFRASDMPVVNEVILTSGGGVGRGEQSEATASRRSHCRARALLCAPRLAGVSVPLDEQGTLLRGRVSMSRQPTRRQSAAGGATWKTDVKATAFQLCRELAREFSADAVKFELKDVRKVSFAGGVEKFARSDPSLAVTSETWDLDPFLLGTPDGTVDLRSAAPMPTPCASTSRRRK